MAQSQSKNLSLNKKNPIAKNLNDRRYHQRVIKNKKTYERKKYNLVRGSSEWEMSDL